MEWLLFLKNTGFLALASLGPSNSELLQDWIPPESGCMKFNVDGSFNTVAAGCGGVLRSSNGNMRAIFSGPVEYFGSDFAELMAVKTALSIFLEAGWMGKEQLSRSLSKSRDR
ncbi:hypothetical protein GQ457_14G024400 [Hibiscus cannabinus]